MIVSWSKSEEYWLDRTFLDRNENDDDKTRCVYDDN